MAGWWFAFFLEQAFSELLVKKISIKEFTLILAA